MSENTITEAPESTDEIVVADFFTAEIYSPYGVITTVNKVLKALGVDKELPGPMGYTYCKKGYITTVPGTDKKKVTKAHAIEWAEKYIGKLAAKMIMETERVESPEDVEEVNDTESELLISE